jgi:hypothetical protein
VEEENQVRRRLQALMKDWDQEAIFRKRKQDRLQLASMKKFKQQKKEKRKKVGLVINKKRHFSKKKGIL